jgi:hypothetical protein
VHTTDLVTDRVQILCSPGLSPLNRAISASAIRMTSSIFSPVSDSHIVTNSRRPTHAVVTSPSPVATAHTRHAHFCRGGASRDTTGKARVVVESIEGYNVPAEPGYCLLKPSLSVTHSSSVTDGRSFHLPALRWSSSILRTVSLGTAGAYLRQAAGSEITNSMRFCTLCAALIPQHYSVTKPAVKSHNARGASPLIKG